MRASDKGATLVEAAMIIPLLLLLIFGLIELGRFVSVQATVSNASREAARYATTSGPGSGGGPRYADCDGMRDAAKQFGVLVEPTDGQISIQYDEGPSTTIFATCAGSSIDPSLLETGDRVVVVVTVPYATIVPYMDNFLKSTSVSVQTVRSINKG